MASHSMHASSMAGAIPAHAQATGLPKTTTQQQQQFAQQQFLADQQAACAAGNPSGLIGMSALWPSCRNYLRNLPLGRECRSLFNLEPNVTFLNHNAYGTAARPVLQAQAHLVNKMEMNPDRFFRRELPTLLRLAASKLAEFLKADAEDVVFVTNATTGMNAVLRSVDLQEGDEVLCLNLTYPSVLNTLRHLCYCTQEFVELKVVDVNLPIPSYEAFVNQVAAAITPNTRLAVLDHITSTGFVLPLEKLIPLFHAKGIPVLVDGASAPGQLPLNLSALEVDFYVGSSYKWLFGSKSCSFLYVAKEHQNTVRPVVTSLNYGQSFVEDFSVQGTRDEANFLTIVTALDFYESVGFERVFAHNKALMDWASNYLSTLWGTESLLPPWQRAPFVSNVRLPINWPVGTDGQPLTSDEVVPICEAIVDLLADRFLLTVRIAPLQDALYVRISAQMYNERRDFELLGSAILELTKTPSLSEYLSQLSL
ncbi:hypothetical protein Poli38472_003492 [Pythium oligandrum]|uniref:Aminotransferase class V domain-containing protein n=1 Tax=Pythium oligandrum TaxID=41045 RepID=A0A8K1C7R4_PYTOL|nr:hypothetical protein Poli38472_003492 [Pythium oligandrum]|eukprot:TMW57567.1 hypothetical protein Poli38472_003492 [Pythium oligandrum]